MDPRFREDDEPRPTSPARRAGPAYSLISMIPYIHSSTFTLAGITFQTWGTLVALGYAVGTYVAYRRAVSRGLDADKVLDVAVWIFFAAFIGARLFHAVAYEPAYYLAHPFELLDVRRPGYAMFGGFLGAGFAAFWFFRYHALEFFSYADTLIWGVPWGCGVGRIGCFLIHDHPGTLTHFILGVRYPNGETRHDLGLYLSLVGWATGGLFLYLHRRERDPGFWVMTYAIIECCSRFLLDFLRVGDARYLAFTPTQWLCLLGLVVIVFMKYSFVLWKPLKKD